MRLAITIIFAALTAISSAQGWEETPTKDEFGDLTGGSVLSQYCEGTFSNSATANSDLTVRISIQQEILMLDLYEYNQQPGAKLSREATLGKIKVKRADGTVEEYQAFAPDQGGLWFPPGYQMKFLDLVMDGDGEEITVLIKEEDFSEYGTASYRFKMVTMGGDE